MCEAILCCYERSMKASLSSIRPSTNQNEMTATDTLHPTSQTGYVKFPFRFKCRCIKDSIKTELDPNALQRGALSKHIGAALIVAPRSFPSTRLCSRCEACGLEVDRDLNAAVNLQKYGLAHFRGSTGSSPRSDACRDRLCGGTTLKGRSTSHGSRKQEVACGRDFLGR